MASKTDPYSIEYGVFAASDANPMARLLGEVFSRRDPPAVAAGVTPLEFEAFVQPFCSRAAAEGLTTIARLASTGELVGALLTEDYTSAAPDGMEGLTPKLDPIFDILGQLDADYRGDSEVQFGERLHLFLLGVAETVAGRGVARQLVTTCLEHGASKGYRLAITEATNRVSQHIFHRQGFVERSRRSYQTYRFEGRAVFESIADEGGPILMEKSLAL